MPDNWPDALRDAVRDAAQRAGLTAEDLAAATAAGPHPKHAPTAAHIAAYFAGKATMRSPQVSALLRAVGLSIAPDTAPHLCARPATPQPNARRDSLEIRDRNTTWEQAAQIFAAHAGSALEIADSGQNVLILRDMPGRFRIDRTDYGWIVSPA
jgi:hypothetical protein